MLVMRNRHSDLDFGIQLERVGICVMNYCSTS